jgi:hypothetical protein
MFTIIQLLLDTAPLPVVLLCIICATVVILAALMLCALFPELGTTIADIVDTWRNPGYSRCRQTHRRSRSRVNQAKQRKMR